MGRRDDRFQADRFAADRFKRSVEWRLVAGFAVLLYGVGGGLVWWFYGAGAALLSWLCFTVAALFFAALYGLLVLVGRWAGE
jgi:hypothetical protein